LGLDHTGDSPAFMWAFYPGPRGLGADDIAGIESLFGPRGGEAAPDPAPCQVQLFTIVNLRIRAQPTTSSQQVGTLAPNVQVPVLARNPQTTWAYIDYNGVVGWESLSFETVIGDINTVPVVQPGGADPTPPPPGDNPPIDPGAAVSATTTTNVVLRSGPGTNFARVTVVPFNTTVPVLGRNAQNSWVYVEYNNQPGWMAAFLVNIIGDLNAVPVVPPEGPGGNPTPPPDAPDPEPQGVTARANANIVIRSGPSVDNDRVGSLPFGSVVPVVGRNSNGQWILIEYQGQQGWIAAWLTTINGSLNDVPIVPGT
ncbi:MAG: SH3 domain-containing protein, partial [Anaerolineae bacterium]